MHLSPDISLRNTGGDDLDFCLRLYIEGRKGEVEAFGWGEDEASAFLRMQFEARERAYRFQFPGLIDEIVIMDGSPVGRILTFDDDDAMVLVDIALAINHQGSGIGTRVLGDLQSRASAADKRILLRVDKGNLPAIGFYKKLGFVIDDESQIQYSMSWQGPVKSNAEKSEI